MTTNAARFHEALNAPFTEPVPLRASDLVRQFREEDPDALDAWLHENAETVVAELVGKTQRIRKGRETRDKAKRARFEEARKSVQDRRARTSGLT